MPNESLARAFETSAQGFQSKLSAVMGTVQNIQQTQMTKQQMRDKLEQQKGLIEFRSDIEFEKQKRIQEEISGPAQQQAAQQSALEAQQESFNSAQEEARTWRGNFLDSKKNPAREFGFLDNVDFQPVDRGDGTFVTMPVQFGEDGMEPMDWGTYQREQADANQAAELLMNIRNQGAELAEVDSTQGEDGGINIGSNNYAQILNDVRREGYRGPTMQRLMAANQQERLNVQTPVESRVEASRLNAFGSEMQRLAQRIGVDTSEDQTIINIASDVPEQRGMIRSGLDWATGREAGTHELSINMMNDYTRNAREIERFADNFGVDIKEIPKDNTEGGRAIRNAIMRGDSEALESNGYDRYVSTAEGVKDLKELLGEDRFNFMMKYYAEVPANYNEWTNEGFFKGRSLPNLDQIAPNFRFDGSIDKLFRTTDTYNQPAAERIENANTFMSN